MVTVVSRASEALVRKARVRGPTGQWDHVAGPTALARSHLWTKEITRASNPPSAPRRKAISSVRHGRRESGATGDRMRVYAQRGGDYEARIGVVIVRRMTWNLMTTAHDSGGSEPSDRIVDDVIIIIVTCPYCVSGWGCGLRFSIIYYNICADMG